MISGSNIGFLNWDSPTWLPSNANAYAPPVSLSSASLITCSNWQTKTNLGSDKLNKRRLSTNCQKGERILHTIILKVVLHYIPSGRHHPNADPVPAEILENMRARDDFRSRDPTSPTLQQINNEITRTTNQHWRQTWRPFVEALDHKQVRPFQTVENYQGNRWQITDRG